MVGLGKIGEGGKNLSGRKVLPLLPIPHPPFSKDSHPYRIPPLSLTLRQQSKAPSFFFKKKRQRRGKPPNRDSIKTKVLGGWGWGFGEGEGPFWKGALPPPQVNLRLRQSLFQSARMSLIFSMPTESRTMPGVIPALTSCSSVSWRCVELAGCSTQVRMSATCTSREAILRLSMNSTAPASRPPLERRRKSRRCTRWAGILAARSL